MMTDEQVYGAVVEWWRKRGIPPSVRDVASMLGVSTSTAHRHLRSLADAGAVHMPKGTHRCIEPVGRFAVIGGRIHELGPVS